MDADNIEVEHSYASGDGTGTCTHTVVITDRKANRAWSGEGDTYSKAGTEATRKFLGDRRAKEYVE